MQNFIKLTLKSMTANIKNNFFYFSFITTIIIFLITIWSTFEKYIIRKAIPYELIPETIASDVIAACQWASSKFLIFSGNIVDNLVYFSHFIPFFIALVVGLTIFIQKPKNQMNRVFLFMALTFCVWVFADIVTWANEDPANIMFFWSLMFPIEGLLFLGYILFSHLEILEKPISWKTVTLFILPLLPVFLLWGTKHALNSFILTDCSREAQEGWLASYLYAYEFILVIIHFTFLSIGLKNNKYNPKRKRAILWQGVALGILMLSMTLGSFISSLLDNWQIAQYSILIMPILLMIIGLIMTRYQGLGKKYHGIQINVIILIILIGSLFILPDFSLLLFQIVLFIILIYVLILGWQLYESSKEQEIYQEKLESINNELLLTQKKLTELDASKNEFLSFATHQLRSPLTSFKWGLDIINDNAKKCNDSETIGIVSKLRMIADDMIGTVNDLLDISKIEQGGFQVVTEDIDLIPLLDRISEEYRINAENKGLRLIFKPEIPTALISGDGTKLQQVVGNLIDNAIKYTPSGSITVKIQELEQKYSIAITDTGLGISAEDLQKLFGKFKRGSAGKSSASGSGLGLYLSKKIVELHHGDITVSSEGQGKGSTFSITLPKK